MARHAAARCQDALRRVHAVDILRRCFDADEDDGVAHFVAALGSVGVEHDQAGCSTRRSGQPLGQHVAQGLGVERGVEQLVERGGIDAGNGFFLGDQPFMRHVHGHFERRLGSALA